MQIIKEIACEHEMFIYVAPHHALDAPLPIIYVLDGLEVEKKWEAIMQPLEKKILKGEMKPFIAVGVYAKERQNEYTPWPVEGIAPKFMDFGGQAESYLLFLKQQLMPYIEEKYNVDKCHVGLMGYSLGGLFAMYAAFNEPSFTQIASISGSSWYPDLVEFVANSTLANANLKLYMSSGEDEGAGKTNILKDAGMCTKAIMKSFENKVKGPEYFTTYFDQGGHHNYLVARYQKAIEWFAKGILD